MASSSSLTSPSSAGPKAQHVFYSSIHPDRDAEFKRSAPPKKIIKEGRKEAILGCTQCGKMADEEKGVKLKKCTGCTIALYCSKECQKENWPSHKKYCSDVLGAGIQPLVKSITGNPMLAHYVEVCLALEFKLDRIHALPTADRITVTRAPLLAHIDVGIEPSKIAEFMNMYTYPDSPDAEDAEDMEGMLQLHDLVSPWPGVREGRRTLSDMHIEIWRTARQAADEDGEGDCPVVLVQFVNNFQQSITCTMTVSKDAVDSARRKEPFVMCSAITRKETKKPLSIASCFEYINTHIRSDKTNRLFLRTPMREVDKELIRNLGRKVDSHATRALKVKVDREHVYVSHSAEFVRESLQNLAQEQARPVLGENRQIEGGDRDGRNEVDEEKEDDGDDAAANDQGQGQSSMAGMNRAERRRRQREEKKQQKRRK